MTEPLPRRPGGSVRVRVTERRGEVVTRREDRVVTEEPLEIRIGVEGANPRRAMITMRTPGHDFELAAGWAIHDGLITASDVRRVAYCTDRELSPEEQFNVVTVTVTRMLRTPAQRAAATSACGVCGSDSIEGVFNTVSDAVARPTTIAAEVIAHIPDAMRPHQALFDHTGGIHAAALIATDGQLLLLREDVGRHNAVDKLTGAQALSRADYGGEILGTSGRIGFEIVQKAVVSHRTAVVGVGAPTSLAVRLAREAGLVLAGFTRSNRFVVYAGDERVTA